MSANPPYAGFGARNPPNHPNWDLLDMSCAAHGPPSLPRSGSCLPGHDSNRTVVKFKHSVFRFRGGRGMRGESLPLNSPAFFEAEAESERGSHREP